MTPQLRADFATPVILGGILVLAAVAASFATPALQRVVTEALVYIVMVVGLHIFCGNSGVTSFGHASFMIVAGYSSAIFTVPVAKKHALLGLPSALEQVHLPWPLAFAAASALAALAALAAGLPLMRLRGVVPSMATFALLIITHTVAQNWKAVTGGRQALVGIPLDTTLWTALSAALLTIAAAAAYQQSKRGALLRCTRENEVAAEAIGIDIARERLLAFVISAFFAGLGGVLFAHFLGTLNANTFYLNTTFMMLAMLIVGGGRSLSGAVAGVVLLSAIAELFRSLERGVTFWGTPLVGKPGMEEVALALIMLAVLLFRQQGVFGDAEIGPLIRRILPGPAKNDSTRIN